MSHLPARRIQQRRYTVSHTDKRMLHDPSSQQTKKAQRTSIDFSKRKVLLDIEREDNYGSNSQGEKHSQRIQQKKQQLPPLQQQQKNEHEDQEQQGQQKHPQRRTSALAPHTTLMNHELDIYNRGGSLATSKARKLPRDIKSMEFQRKAISNMIDYLTRHDYQPKVERRTLRNLASNDFRHIFKFLLGRLDMNQRYQDSNDEGIVDALKALSYPSVDTINPRSLYPIAPHTLSTALAILSWMVDACKLNDDVRKQMEKDEESIHLKQEMGSDELDMLFFDYSVAQYNAFMKGDDEGKTIVSELKSIFDAMGEGTLEQIKEVNRQRTALEEEAEEVKRLMASFDTIRQEKRSADEHVSRLQEEIENKKRKLAKYTEVMSKSEGQVKMLENAIASIYQEKATVQSTIKNPHITNEEIDKLSSLQVEWEKEVDASRIKLEEIQQQTRQKEIQMRKLDTQIQQAIIKFNDFIKKLDHHLLQRDKVSPVIAASAATPLIFHTDAAQLDQMLSIDVRKDVMPELKNLKTSTTESAEQFEKKEIEIQQKWQRLQAQLREQLQRNHDLEHMLSRQQKEYQQVEENAKQVNLQLQQERDDSRRAVERMKNEVEAQLLRKKNRELALQSDLHESKMKSFELKEDMMYKVEELMSHLRRSTEHVELKIKKE